MLNGPRYTCAFFSSERVKLIFSFAPETEVIPGAILIHVNVVSDAVIDADYFTKIIDLGDALISSP